MRTKPARKNVIATTAGDIGLVQCADMRMTGLMCFLARLIGRPADACLLVGLLMISPAYTWGACVELPYPDIRRLQELSERAPNSALPGILAEIQRAERTASGQPQRLAAWYAAAAQSYSLLELDADARAMAEKGLGISLPPDHPTRVFLQATFAENVYDSRQLDLAAGSIEQARSLQARGSIQDLCLQITAGTLQNRQGRVDRAILTLTDAYRRSLGMQAPRARIAAAAALSAVMRILGDFKQALALNREVIDWNLNHHATLSLSVARYMQGEIYLQMGESAAAITELQEARTLSIEVADQQGVAFADLALCDARTETGSLREARGDCQKALDAFTASHSTDVQKESLGRLAQIDLLEGHPESSLSRLNSVLDRSGSDMQPRIVPQEYRLRAQANARLANYKEAYADLEEYLRRYVSQSDAQRSLEISALRARFETDTAIQRSDSLESQLTLAREREELRTTQLRWMTSIFAASAVVIALLTYLLVSNMRYRRRLVRLATTDTLTGIANRGRVAELASQSLAAARELGEPLCVALLDLDRFKAINDQFGHAVGDRVLREFVRIASASLRPSDLFGRWGGEEFLLVLPRTPLHSAVSILNAIRENASRVAHEVGEPGLRVSMSAGVAAADGAHSLDEIIARADAALYNAKSDGRDLVRCSEESLNSASTIVRRALRTQGQRRSHT